jgi:hypothetical protein
MIMRKLNLDTLQVESFATTDAPHQMRGTVQGHAQVTAGTTIAPGTGVSDCLVCQPMSIDVRCVFTYDLRDCGETRYMDCTYGCTRFNSCGQVCWIEADTPACAVK